MNERKYSVLVALQQALLGEVSCCLRAVTVSFGETRIHFDCYFDKEVTEEEIESMSCVEAELMAVFPANHDISHELHKLEFPNLIPKQNHWVYHRKEELD